MVLHHAGILLELHSLDKLLDLYSPRLYRKLNKYVSNYNRRIKYDQMFSSFDNFLSFEGKCRIRIKIDTLLKIRLLESMLTV